VMWLNVIDEGMPTARRKGIVSSLVECRFAPANTASLADFHTAGRRSQ
jgi:hypothetical protein